MNEAMEDSFRGFIAEGADIDSSLVIPRDDKGPLPEPTGSSKVFATVLPLVDEAVGHTWGRRYPASYTTDPATWDGLQADGISTTGVYRQVRRATMSVQLFNRGARFAADRLSIWIDTDIGKLREEKYGFRVLRETLLVRRIDAIISAEWEERVGLDMGLHYYQDMALDVGRVDSLDIDLCLDGGGEDGITQSLELDA